MTSFVRFLARSMALATLLFAGAVAHATTYYFNATSTSAGFLGSFHLDSSVLDGSSFQYVDNSLLLGLDFTNPYSGFHVTTIGPVGQGTFIDSSGLLPTVVGGIDFTGGTSFDDGVWIAGTSYIYLAGNSFSDVAWTTTTAPVPEPETYAMLLAGLGIIGAVARRRKQA